MPSVAIGTAPIMEYKDLDDKLTRKELAAIGVRMHQLEDFTELYWNNNYFTDVKGWATPYINSAYDFDIMKGTSKDKFKPDDNVSYVELLTVMMRAMGYKDGIDFVKYPEDYYNKALEIGLANMYIPHNQTITRGIAYDTLSEEFDMRGTTKNAQSPAKEPEQKSTTSSISIKDQYFNTSIAGVFTGELVGLTDFSGYKVELLSSKNRVYDKITLKKSGKFSITGFEVDLLARLDGYRYRVYDDKGNLVLEGDL